MIERLNATLTESIITLLCHDNKFGKIIAHSTDPNLFEGDYRVIAERAIAYWKQYNQAPGSHTDDLVSNILDDPKNRRAGTYRRILVSMIELSQSINAAYVMDKLAAFTRMQNLKSGIIQSAERLQSQQHMAISEVENIWNGLLRRQEPTFDKGIGLGDIDHVLSHLENRQHEFLTGVAPLDKARIVPERNTVFLVLAPAKKGKTWFLVEIGKQAILQRKKVLHISLEVDAEDIVQRYWQALFGVAKYKDEELPVTVLEFDEDNRIKGYKRDNAEPSFTFQSPLIREELESHTNWLGAKANYLLVKRYPTRSVNMNDIRGFIDNLEIVEKFMPDMTIIDYPGLFKTDIKNHRLDLGRQFEEFRGLCVERHMAGVAVHQSTRGGARADSVETTDVAEDWSFIHTCDKVVTFSQTKAEERLGLARLGATARTEKGAWTCVITQNYALGQFCVDSAVMSNSYSKLMKSAKDDEVNEDDDDD